MSDMTSAEMRRADQLRTYIAAQLTYGRKDLRYVFRVQDAYAELRTLTGEPYNRNKYFPTGYAQPGTVVASV